MKNHLTDRQIVEIFSGFQKHYKNLKRQGLASDTQIYNLMWDEFSSLLSHSPAFNKLSFQEKNKAVLVFNTLFDSFIHVSNPKSLQDLTISAPHVAITYNSPYYSNNDLLLTWVIIGSTISSSSRNAQAHNPKRKEHTHFHPSIDTNDDNNTWAALALICLGLIAVVAVCICLVYLLHASLMSLERFYYNEGWLQATLNIAGVLAGGFVASVLSSLFMTTPLMALSVSAGVATPIIVALLGVACLGVLGAAIGYLATANVQDLVIKHTHKNAMDSADPHRYQLTSSDMNRLQQKGLDPIKIKCAMVALRAEMEKYSDSSHYRWFSNSLWYRNLTGKGCYKQDKLNEIRRLRRGELTEISIGEMNFQDLRLTTQPDPFVPSAPPHPAF